MIDTHVHLNDNTYNDILDDVISDAIINGVDRFFVIGCDYETSKKAIEIAHKYKNVYALVGLHPSEVDKEIDNELNWLKEMIKDELVIGIGEIGLDLYWTKDNIEKQMYYYDLQLKIAYENNLPVSIHSREAISLTYNGITNYNIRGIIHCFSGSYEMAQKFIDRGFLIGIGGVITFKNSKLPLVVEKISINNIVSETDGPYLAPVPYRGKINKPEYISLIVDEIARIKNLSKTQVEKAIDDNIKRVFNV